MPSVAVLPSVADLITRRMARDAADAVRAVGRAAERVGTRPYLVGGCVRDLLAARPAALDIDVALEGADAAAFDRIAADCGGRVSKRSMFATARLNLGGLSVDLAMTRAERYPTPGSLPQVRPASLAEDLARRDFSVNAMAVSIASETFGELADPHNGARDLRQSRLRALHERSFRDDATRIIRAARYCARLSLRSTDDTRRWTLASAPFISRISPARVRAELERVFLEGEAAARAMALLEEWGALAAIHPALSFDRQAWLRFSDMAHERASERVGEMPKDAIIPTAYAIIGATLTDAQAGGIIERLRPAARAVRALADAANLNRRLANEPRNAADLPASRLIAILDQYDARAAAGVSLTAPAAAIRERVSACIRARANDRPFLNGDDLIALGVPRGPMIGETLTRLRAARLDGETLDREDERRLATELARDRLRPPPA